jgi:hypothetical protein
MFYTLNIFLNKNELKFFFLLLWEKSPLQYTSRITLHMKSIPRSQI